MQKVRKASLAALILFMFAVSPVSEARDTFYIAPSQVCLIQVLGPPPAASSQRQKEDLAAVLDAQRTRGEREAKSAAADSDMSLFAFVGDMMGPDFKRENLPVTVPFFERVFVDQMEAAWGVKEHFSRPRPFAIDPRVKPVVRKPRSASYPSGHALAGYVYATILSIMVPEKAYELYERAAVYGRQRVVGGVHFPTDIEAGRVSAAVIAHTLLQQPLFVRDLERAKTEVRQVMGLK